MPGTGSIAESGLAKALIFQEKRQSESSLYHRAHRTWGRSQLPAPCYFWSCKFENRDKGGSLGFTPWKLPEQPQELVEKVRNLTQQPLSSVKQVGNAAQQLAEKAACRIGLDN